MGAIHGLSTDVTSSNLNNSTWYLFAQSWVFNGKTKSRTWKYLREQSRRASGQCWSKPNYAGLVMSSQWRPPHPEQLLYGELCEGKRKPGRPKLRYKERHTLKQPQMCKTPRPEDLNRRQRNLEVPDLHLQPRSQALFSPERKTLVGSGHVVTAFWVLANRTNVEDVLKIDSCSYLA